MDNYFDISFPVFGTEILYDHGYSLFSAISKIIPEYHDTEDVAMLQINLQNVSNGKGRLHRASRLRFRVNQHWYKILMSLVGQAIQIKEDSVQLGIPEPRPLIPSSNLRARYVIVNVRSAIENKELYSIDKDSQLREIFGEAIKRQIENLDISKQVSFSLGKRKALIIKNKTVVGYELVVNRLSADESIIIQQKGIGGRRKFGAGFFLPIKN